MKSDGKSYGAIDVLYDILEDTIRERTRYSKRIEDPETLDIASRADMLRRVSSGYLQLNLDKVIWDEGKHIGNFVE